MPVETLNYEIPKPQKHSFIEVIGNKPVPLIRDITKETVSFFCNAQYDKKLKSWYLTESATGLKCFISYHQHNFLKTLEKNNTAPTVTKLVVTRIGRNNTSLICEITAEDHARLLNNSNIHS